MDDSSPKDQVVANFADQADGGDDPVNAEDHGDHMDIEAPIGARTESTLDPRHVGPIGAHNLARGSDVRVEGPIGTHTGTNLARGSVVRAEGPIGAGTRRRFVVVEGEIGTGTESNLARRRVVRVEAPIGEARTDRNLGGVDAPIGAQVPIGEARGASNRNVRSLDGLIIHSALLASDVNAGGSSSDTAGKSSVTGYRCSDVNHPTVYDDLEQLALHNRAAHSRKYSWGGAKLRPLPPPPPEVSRMVYFDISITDRDSVVDVKPGGRIVFKDDIDSGVGVDRLGKIVIGLYGTDAPEAANAFLDRCRGKGYKWSIFHHVMNDFVVVGGDFRDINGLFHTSGGQSLPAYNPVCAYNRACDRTLKSWNYNFSHTGPGVVSMEEGRIRFDSQFFIFTHEAHQWDERHVVIGHVLEGMDIVEQIKSQWIELEGARDTNGLSRKIVYISNCGLPFPVVPSGRCAQS